MALDTDQLSELASNASGFVLLVDLDIDPHQYLNTSDYDITWNAHNYRGAGALCFIEDLDQDTTLESQALRIGLAGEIDGNIAIALGDPMQSKDCFVRFAVLDRNHRIIGEPSIEYKGKIDVPTIVEDENKITISIAIETRLVRIMQRRQWMFADADQRRLYGEDRYYEHLPNMMEKVFSWAKRFNQQ